MILRGTGHNQKIEQCRDQGWKDYFRDVHFHLGSSAGGTPGLS